MTFEGRTIRENLCGGVGRGAKYQKKYSRKGKLNEKNSCTPINPKKYSCHGLKKIHTRNLMTKKIPAARKFPSPHKISNGPSLNVTQTTAKITLIRSVAVWNPPQCNLGILDLRTNKNLQCLVTRTIPNWTKPKISLEYYPRNAHTAAKI